MRLTSLFKAALAGVILLASCAKNPAPPQASDINIPDYEELVPGGLTNFDGQDPTDTNPVQTLPPQQSVFIQTMNQLGVRLSDAEIQQIQTLTKVNPTGEWAPSRDKTADENLEANFLRFGNLFLPPPNDANEYKDKAKTFAEKLNVPYYMDVKYYLDTQEFLLVKWDENSKEFVVVRPDGSLVNYLLSSAITPPRYLKVDI